MTDDTLATKVEPEINPYQKLGKEYDPFGVANMFNLPFCLAEAFKKLACAGIDGRIKSKDQDVKEAVYSVKRAIEYFHSNSFQVKTDKTISDITTIGDLYRDAFGLDESNDNYLRIATFILYFAVELDVEWLEWVIKDCLNPFGTGKSFK